MMATVIVENIVDDLDRHTDPQSQTPADETVRFAIDGASYVIDLTEAHAKELREKLSLYTEAGRRTRAPRGRPRAVRQRSASVRAWARKQGIPVSDHGRIAAGVVERYEAAHR